MIIKSTTNVMKKALLGVVFLFTPVIVSAAITDLNGETGATQSFVNDTNVTVTSGSNTHTLGWSGLLAPVRGGTGVDISSFATGTVLLVNDGKVAADGLVFDSFRQALVTNIFQANQLIADYGIKIHYADNVSFYGDGDEETEHLGSVGMSSVGTYSFNNTSYNGLLDFSQIATVDKIFTFPDFSGTLGLLEAGQTWSGENTFSKGASATTTVTFGELGDSSSKTCFNTKNTAGDDISFYFVGTTMVVESNVCQ